MYITRAIWKDGLRVLLLLCSGVPVRLAAIMFTDRNSSLYQFSLLRKINRIAHLPLAALFRTPSVTISLLTFETVTLAKIWVQADKSRCSLRGGSLRGGSRTSISSARNLPPTWCSRWATYIAIRPQQNLLAESTERSVCTLCAIPSTCAHALSTLVNAFAMMLRSIL